MQSVHRVEEDISNLQFDTQSMNHCNKLTNLSVFSQAARQTSCQDMDMKHSCLRDRLARFELKETTGHGHCKQTNVFCPDKLPTS